MVFEDYSTDYADLEHRQLIFGYEGSSDDESSSFPGYSVKVYSNNTIELAEYRALERSEMLETSVTPFAGIRFEGNKRVINHIKWLIEQYAPTIEAMPDCLYYDIYGGTVDTFWFGNKTISAYSIHWVDLIEVKRDLDLDEEYLQTVKNGNKLLHIYNDIARALSRYKLLRRVEEHNQWPEFDVGVKAICGGIGMSEAILESMILRIFEKIAISTYYTNEAPTDRFLQGKDEAYRDVVGILADALVRLGIDPAEYGLDDCLNKGKEQ